MVELPYGRVPYPLELGNRLATIVSALPRPHPRAPTALLAEALEVPNGRPRVERLLSHGDRLTVIVSDATRDEPRRAFLEVLRERLPAVRWTIAIATGTHGPSELEQLDLPRHVLRDASIVNHDGHSDAGMVTLGTTSRGTPVRLHRCVADASLVIATGCIRPHYFAGFGAGVKAIFPGLGSAAAIRQNHLLKAQPGARAGMIDGNPCRADLEEAVDLVPAPVFLLNGVCGPDTRMHAAVAGCPRVAFRAGAELARSWFTVRGPRAKIVIASDSLPVAGSLYQAAKIAAAASVLVEPGGILILVAECCDGIGPLATVNESIFRIGVLPRLPPDVTIRLVSSLPHDLVAQTLVSPADSVEELLRDRPEPVVVVPHASQLLIEPFP